MNQTENAVASLFHRKFSLLTGRCTTAMFLSLKALGKKRGEVIVPATICPDVVYAVKAAGMKPVFADCRLDDYNMDPTSVAAKVTDRTAAIMAVHLFGFPCQIDELRSIAKESDLSVIDDIAQAAGTFYRSRLLGASRDTAVVSFGNWKILDAGGGGAILTDDERLLAGAKAIQADLPMRNQYIVGPGAADNKRIAKSLLTLWTNKRIRVKNGRRLSEMFYDPRFSAKGPAIPKGTNVFRYSVLVSSQKLRNRLYEGLNSRGIYARKMYPTFDRRLPNSRKIQDTILNFIVWPPETMTDAYFENFEKAYLEIVR